MQFLCDRHKQLVVATSADEKEMSALLERAGVADLMPRRTSKDDAPRSKPDVDIVQAALRRASARAEDAVMIGDTPYDVEAARRATIPCIALRSGGYWSDDDLDGAVVILDDPALLGAGGRAERLDALDELTLRRRHYELSPRSSWVLGGSQLAFRRLFSRVLRHNSIAALDFRDAAQQEQVGTHMAQQHGTQNPKDDQQRSGGQTSNPGQGGGTGPGRQGDRKSPSERPKEQGREGQDTSEGQGEKRGRENENDPGKGTGRSGTETKRDNK